MNSHVLGLNAGITGLLPSYGVNSQALMQDGMKSQAIWEHTVISHVIRFTDSSINKMAGSRRELHAATNWVSPPKKAPHLG